MKKKSGKKKENTGSAVQPTVMTYSGVRPIDDEPLYDHDWPDDCCQKCGGPMWPIHDKQTGLVIYHKCGHCGEKR